MASLRVLIVEDEPLIAMELERLLCELGYRCLGPIPTLKEALFAAQSEVMKGAVVDLKLRGEFAYPVLAQLAAREIPFVIVTGFPRNGIDSRWATRPFLPKPFGPDAQARLARTLGSPNSSAWSQSS